MTKKELELENNFLKLQLKIINALVLEFEELGNSSLDSFEVCRKLGLIRYHSDLEECKDNFSFIKENDLPYNFFDESMKI